MEKHMFEKLSFRKVFKFILALLLFSCSVSGYAEVLDNRVVKGVVKDELGEPLPAVTVVVKGTTNGVTTDWMVNIHCLMCQPDLHWYFLS